MAKKEKQKKQYDAKKHIQMTGSDRVMNGGFYLFITVFSIICLIPFLLVLGSSFTAERALTQNGYNIWPSEFSLDAYKLVFVSGDIPQAYLNCWNNDCRNFFLNGIYMWCGICDVCKEF